MNDLQNKKVSIIVPIYNREDYIDRCISSMVNQTYKNIEIILVDDGSTDKSAEICDTYAGKDSRVIVIHKPNGGVSSARNAGLDIMTGDYVCFCDSDDYFETTMVEKSLEQILAEKADMCTFKNYHNNEKVENVFDPVNIDIEIFDCASFFANYIHKGQAPYCVWSSIYNASLIKEFNIRFCDYKKVFSEDSLFNLMFWTVCKKYTHLNDCLYYYFRHENSLMTSSVPGDYIRRHIALIEDYENFVRSNKIKAKLGSATACLMWDFVRIACARSKKQTDIVVKDFQSVSDNKLFKRKCFDMAFGRAGSMYCKNHKITGKNALHIRYIAGLLLLNKYEQAAKEYFL
ncbi:MAG: glycosyltransferase family 2 protein [Clostridia bacterium]|nr:glycosyltransferase family 2 protein [Clostridia bacterium]